jgi:hypothetical protein
MTINANNSTTPASTTGRVVSSANTLGHGPVQSGTPGKTLPNTPQVKQSIAAIRSAYNTYRQSGGKESIQAWLQPQIEEVLKERQTTSAQTLQNKLPTGAKPMDDVGVGTALGILADLMMEGGGPIGLVAGAIIDGVIAGSGGSTDGGGGGSGDGSYGDNPGGGSPA